ncbi:ABC transporter ATP-binding protein [candidate division KSB1 bacterium]
MNNKIIECKNIDFLYQDRPVINSLDLEIERGNYTAIIGPNGSGKTTLLKLLCGILKPDKGEIFIKGEKINSYHRKELAKILTYVPQETSINFPYTVGEIVLMGRTPYISPFETESKEDIQKVEEAMNSAEIWNLKDRYYDQLSSGEKQRVVLASALAQEPEILLLDEPTSNMDPKYRKIFLSILRKLSDKTIIFVSHNLNLTFNSFENIIIVNKGKIEYSGEKSGLLTNGILSRVFETEFLIEQKNGKILISPDYEK